MTANEDRTLTAEQYRVTQQHGTEAPFSGQYYAHKENGEYLCVCCGNSASLNFESGEDER
jgi:peptide-methionine (R)-S-oxide reductase